MIGAILAKKAARDAFAAIDRHDLDALMRAWGAEPVFEFPGGSVIAGRFEGRERIRAWFERWWSRFPTTTLTLGSISVERIGALGGTNTIHVEWRLDETDREGRSFRIRGVTSLRALGGKVVHARDYVFDQDVIAAAWKGAAA